MVWCFPFDSFHREISSYLVRYFIRDWLKSNVTPDQVSIALLSGNVSITDIVLDADQLNDICKSSKIPFTVVEGFIDEVVVSVPWEDLFSKSVQLDVNDLKLVLRSNEPAEKSDILSVSSMFESVVTSMTSPMDLAQSVHTKDEAKHVETETPVEKLAEILDSINSRFKLEFHNTTIRLETLGDVHSELFAFEVQISRIRMSDEQIEDETSDVCVIVNEPHLLSAIPDLNRIFEIDHIKIFIDSADSPHPAPFCEILGESQKVIVRVKNGNISAAEGHSSQIAQVHDIQMNFGTVFILPSTGRLHMLWSIIGNILSGRGECRVHQEEGITSDHINIIKQQVKERIFKAPSEQSKEFEIGNWCGGDPVFHEITAPNTDSERKTVSNTSLSVHMESIVAVVVEDDHLLEDHLKSRQVFDTLSTKARQFAQLTFSFEKSYEKFKSLSIDFQSVLSSNNISFFVKDVKLKLAFGSSGIELVNRPSVHFSADSCFAVDVFAGYAKKKQSPVVFNLFHFNECKRSAAIPSIDLSVYSDQRGEKYDVKCNLQPFCLEVDISVYSRISPLILSFTQCFIESSMSESTKFAELLNARYKLPLEFSLKFTCPEIELLHRIPTMPPGICEDIELIYTSHYVKAALDQYVRLKLKEVEVSIPSIVPAQTHKAKQITINAASLSCYFTKRIRNSIADENYLFLHAINSGLNHIRIDIECDARNLIVREAVVSNTTRKKTCFDGDVPLVNLDVIDGPFTKSLHMFEGETIRSVGSYKELEAFKEECFRNSVYNVRVKMPALYLYLRDHQFFQDLYNSFLNGYFTWNLISSLIKERSGAHNAFDPYVDQSIFYSCNLNSTASEDAKDIPKNSFHEYRVPSWTLLHKLCASVDIGKLKTLLCAGRSEQMPSSPSHICMALYDVSVCAVNEFRGRPEEAYVYVRSKASKLYYKNIELVETNDNAMNLKKFCDLFGKEDLFVSPTQKADLFDVTLVDDDNFAIGLRVLTNGNENVQDVLAAVAFRNTSFRIETTRARNNLIITQLINFFTVECSRSQQTPSVNIDLHLNIASCTWAYDHPLDNGDLVSSIRLCVKSCDINCAEMLDADMYRLIAYTEGVALFMARKSVDANKAHYIKLLTMETFSMQMNVSSRLIFMEGNCSNDSPIIDIKCKNNLLEMWCCSDSLSALIDIVSQIVRPEASSSKEDVVKQCASIHASSEYGRVYENGQSVHAQLSRLQEIVESTVMSSSFSFPTPRVPSKNCCYNKQSDRADDSETTIPNEKVHRPKENSANEGTVEDFEIIDVACSLGRLKQGSSPQFVCLLDDIEMFSDEENCSNDEYFSNLYLSKQSYSYPTSGGSSSLINYDFSDFSILMHFYGGSDFDGKGGSKSYSIVDNFPAKALAYTLDSTPYSGLYRDMSVHVEFMFSKIKFMYQLYWSAAPILSITALSIHNIEIRDKLAASDFNLMLHLCESAKLRRTNAPMFSSRILESSDKDGKIAVSMLPMRLNIDQDTLQFLQDFFSDLYSTFPESANNGSEISVNGVDVLDCTNPAECYDHISEEAACSFAHSADSSNCEMDLLEDADEVPSPEKISFGSRSSSRRSEHFSVRGISRHFKKEPKKEAYELVHVSKSLNGVDASDKQSYDEVEGTFYREFTFSPTVPIRLDYQGKRVKSDQGVLMGLLIGLTSLKCSELSLVQFENSNGLYGFPNCIQFAVNHWIKDIQENQIPNVIGGFVPIKSLVQLGKGVRDLFFMPACECRRREGHVMTGFRKGAESFGVSTITASVEIAQGLAGFLQGAAEVAFDIITPDSASMHRKRLKQYTVNNPNVPPTDIRDGLNRAYETVRQGISETAERLHVAAVEGRAEGHWPLRGLLRQATPTFLRPLVIASKATNQVLGGVKSQWKPEYYAEEAQKWKHEKPTIY